MNSDNMEVTMSLEETNNTNGTVYQICCMNSWIMDEIMSQHTTRGVIISDKYPR